MLNVDGPVASDTREQQNHLFGCEQEERPLVMLLSSQVECSEQAGKERWIPEVPK